ncbi:MAG: hypothetical protein BWY09_01045 [Candidatus Hydrogenedentes bacterium ADurb.Bin179]|nr:MAG: hypothetical protein BWY09_01045 [Candidatus Hydrogenedentes bacterium ADurb.Bin179]
MVVPLPPPIQIPPPLVIIPLLPFKTMPPPLASVSDQKMVLSLPTLEEMVLLAFITMGPTVLKVSVASSPLFLVILPASVMPSGEPTDSTVKFPLILDVPIEMPFASFKYTFFPEATETAPMKLLAALSRVTALVPAVMPVVPPMVKAPLWIISPLAAPRVRLLEIVVAPKLTPPPVGP